MEFQDGYTYHVYNQGNNRQNIFFSEDNYLLFLRKIKQFIKPHASIISYCLMPNHFHFLIKVNNNELLFDLDGKQIMNYTLSDVKRNKVRSLSNSIGIVLRSYTRAINNSLNRSGSLFRPKTKSICVDDFNGPSMNFYTINGVVEINLQHEKKSYKDICIEYIHQNPVKAGLVFDQSEWQFSSAYKL